MEVINDDHLLARRNLIEMNDLKNEKLIYIKNGINVPASRDITAWFFSGAIMHTIRWWLMQKKQISEETLIEEVEKILSALD